MQSNLFDSDRADNCFRSEAENFSNEIAQHGEKLTLQNASVVYFPGWLCADAANAFQVQLTRELKWQQPQIYIAGVPRRIPRLQAWHGDSDAVMTYSGSRFDPQDWHPTLSHLREQLYELLQVQFNSVLANRYRDGNDSVGWHADNEPELGPQPCIASISLGATRRFSFKQKLKSAPRTNKSTSVNIELRHGDLLVMAGQTQRYWHHSLPKTTKQVGERINLTYRTIIQTAR